MPLGVSEQLLSKALGPIDFSHAYNTIEYNQKRLAAEDAAAKKEAMKQYYTDLASLNKEQTGIRSIDMPKAAELYSQWSDASRQLAANPNLINKNPNLYGQLKSVADDLESQLRTHIASSKDLKKIESDVPKRFLNPQTMSGYEDDAFPIWQNEVVKKPVEYVMKNDTANEANYFSKLIDGKKIYDNIESNVASRGTEYHEIDDPTFKGVAGEKRKIVFDKMPDIGKIHTIVTDAVSTNLKGTKAEKFATQQLGEVMSSGDYDRVVNAYKQFEKDGWRKYFPTQPKTGIFDNPKNDTERFVNYETQKRFIDALPMSGKTQQGKFASESQKALFLASLRERAKESGKDSVDPIDTYGKIDSYMNKRPEGTNMPIKGLDADTSGIVIDYAKKLVGNDKLSLADIYLKKKGGKTYIYTYYPVTDSEGKVIVQRNISIGEIPVEKTNIRGNAPLGQAAKIEARNISPKKDPLGIF